MTSANASVDLVLCESRTNEEKITKYIIMSRENRLVSRPKGIPTADNFALVQTELEPLEDRQVLVRNLYMSVDPYMNRPSIFAKSCLCAWKTLERKICKEGQECIGLEHQKRFSHREEK